MCGNDFLIVDYFSFFEGEGLEYLFLLYVCVVFGGLVVCYIYEVFKVEFLEWLKVVLFIDGFYFVMYGVMYVEGMEDVEGDWIFVVCVVVGFDVLVVVSYDLYGNVM